MRTTAHHVTHPAPASTEATMRAVVQDGYGSSEVVHLDRVPVPSPDRARCWSRSAAPGSTGAPGT